MPTLSIVIFLSLNNLHFFPSHLATFGANAETIDREKSEILLPVVIFILITTKRFHFETPGVIKYFHSPCGEQLIFTSRSGISIRMEFATPRTVDGD